MTGMEGDTIAIIVAIVGTGIALWRVNKSSMDRLHGDLGKVRGDLDSVRKDISGLRERMARLEGLFEGFTKRAAPGEGD